MAVPISDWQNEVKIDQLPGLYKDIASEIGVQNAIKLSNILKGTNFYLPKLDALIAKIRNRRIREEFNGDNHRELALKYDLTERWIYEILNKTDGEVDNNQLNFFRENS
jgi:Mor family transcriptional regulator